MKRLIVSIAIIIALIAFFIIFSRKEFNRHNDVQTVQNESSTFNKPPSASVHETKPVTESKLLVSENNPETIGILLIKSLLK